MHRNAYFVGFPNELPLLPYVVLALQMCPTKEAVPRLWQTDTCMLLIAASYLALEE